MLKSLAELGDCNEELEQVEKCMLPECRKSRILEAYSFSFLLSSWVQRAPKQPHAVIILLDPVVKLFAGENELFAGENELFPVFGSG
jgi:hypothetical protein